jgi:hypothetical protein
MVRCKLSRPIVVRSRRPQTLRTYEDAARFVQRQLPGKRQAWIRAAQLLTEGGTAEQVTRQIETALYSFLRRFVALTHPSRLALLKVTGSAQYHFHTCMASIAGSLVIARLSASSIAGGRPHGLGTLRSSVSARIDRT